MVFSEVERDAFRAACIVREVSSTFRFFASAPYGEDDIAHFTVRSLRNRARSDATLKKVTGFFSIFTNLRMRWALLTHFSGRSR